MSQPPEFELEALVATLEGQFPPNVAVLMVKYAMSAVIKICNYFPDQDPEQDKFNLKTNTMAVNNAKHLFEEAIKHFTPEEQQKATTAYAKLFEIARQAYYYHILGINPQTTSILGIKPHTTLGINPHTTASMTHNTAIFLEKVEQQEKNAAAKERREASPTTPNTDCIKSINYGENYHKIYIVDSDL